MAVTFREAREEVIGQIAQAIETSRRNLGPASEENGAHGRHGEHEERAPHFVADVLTRDHVRHIVDETFWASLEEDEHRPVRCRLVFARPASCAAAAVFKDPTPISAAILRRLASGTHSTETGIGIQLDGDRLVVWGLVPLIPRQNLQFEILGTGVISVRLGSTVLGVLRRHEAYFLGDAYDLFGVTGSSEMIPIALLSRALKRMVPEEERASLVSDLWRIGSMMHQVRHGGTLLVVDGTDPSWKDAIDIPERNQLQPWTELAQARELERKQAEACATIAQNLSSKPKTPEQVETFALMTQAVIQYGQVSALDARRRVSQLTAIDGAVVVDTQLRVEGFGGKITAHDRPPKVLQHRVLARGMAKEPVDLEQLGGTRHQSAARFIGLVHKAVAIVVSSDGPIALMSWSDEKQSVVVVWDLECFANVQ